MRRLLSVVLCIGLFVVPIVSLDCFAKNEKIQTNNYVITSESDDKTLQISVDDIVVKVKPKKDGGRTVEILESLWQTIKKYAVPVLTMVINIGTVCGVIYTGVELHNVKKKLRKIVWF